MSATLTQPIKWHGGKHYLAKRIIEQMPPRNTWHLYREPFAGGLSVLLQLDPEGLSEAVNDADGALTNFWSVLVDDDLFEEFHDRVISTPFSEEFWESTRLRLRLEAAQPSFDKVGHAWAFFVRARQSRQGLMQEFATPTRRLRRGMSENVSAWLTAVEGLADVHARLKRVEIRNMEACDFIRKYDDPQAVFYLDPPYVHETRTVADAYEHEMTADDHIELLRWVAVIKGRFLLSGYRCELYDKAAKQFGWRRIDWTIDNKSGSGKTKQKRVESLWMNY